MLGQQCISIDIYTHVRHDKRTPPYLQKIRQYHREVGRRRVHQRQSHNDVAKRRVAQQLQIHRLQYLRTERRLRCVHRRAIEHANRCIRTQQLHRFVVLLFRRDRCQALPLRPTHVPFNRLEQRRSGDTVQRQGAHDQGRVPKSVLVEQRAHDVRHHHLAETGAGQRHADRPASPCGEVRVDRNERGWIDETETDA